MAQYARPSSDTDAASWATTPLWSKVDDDLVSTPSGDGVVINSETVGNGGNTSIARLSLGSVTDPLSSSSHIIRVRWQNGNEGGSGRNIDGYVDLYEGANLRATLGPVTLTFNAGEQQNTYTLSTAEANSITNYGNLEFRLRGTGSGGGPSRSLQVEAVEFEVPNAPIIEPLATALSGSGIISNSINVNKQLNISLTQSATNLFSVDITKEFGLTLNSNVSTAALFTAKMILSQNLVEVLLDSNPKGRLTNHITEVLLDTNPKGRLTTYVVEVLRSISPVSDQGNIATDIDKTAQSSWTANTSVQVNQGQLIVLALATDNEDTVDGNTNLHVSVALGPYSLVKAREYTNSSGAADDGSTISIWWLIAPDTFSASEAIAITLNTGRTAKALTARVFDIASNHEVIIDGTNDLSGDNNDPASLSASGSNGAWHIWVRAIALEENNTTLGSLTPTSNWTAFTGTGTTGGLGNSNQSVRVEFLINQSSSSGASDPSLSATADNANILLGFSIVAGSLLEVSLPVSGNISSVLNINSALVNSISTSAQTSFALTLNKVSLTSTLNQSTVTSFNITLIGTTQALSTSLSISALLSNVLNIKKGLGSSLLSSATESFTIDVNKSLSNSLLTNTTVSYNIIRNRLLNYNISSTAVSSFIIDKNSNLINSLLISSITTYALSLNKLSLSTNLTNSCILTDNITLNKLALVSNFVGNAVGSYDLSITGAIDLASSLSLSGIISPSLSLNKLSLSTNLTNSCTLTSSITLNKLALSSSFSGNAVGSYDLSVAGAIDLASSLLTSFVISPNLTLNKLTLSSSISTSILNTYQLNIFKNFQLLISTSAATNFSLSITGLQILELNIVNTSTFSNSINVNKLLNINLISNMNTNFLLGSNKVFTINLPSSSINSYNFSRRRFLNSDLNISGSTSVVTNRLRKFNTDLVNTASDQYSLNARLNLSSSNLITVNMNSTMQDIVGFKAWFAKNINQHVIGASENEL